MSRGILYIKWGTDAPNAYGFKYSDLLDRSIESAKKFGYEYHVHDFGNDRHSLNCKAEMYDLSPFDETLYLDLDTVILGDLSFGFEQASHHGIALAIDQACYNRRWFPDLGDMVEYNTGVIFFDKNHQQKNPYGIRIRKIFDAWKATSSLFSCWNDQPVFSVTLSNLRINPFVLPENWNYRRYNDNDSIFGPVKIWHSMKEIKPEIQSLVTKNHMGFYNA